MARVTVSFRRHAQKTADGKEITSKGIKDTIRLSRDYKEPTKIYYSPENRTKKTAELLEALIPTDYAIRAKNILRGHKYFSGRRIKETKRDNFLTLFRDIAKRIGITDELLIKIWLNDKFPKKIIPRPEVMADEILKDRFKLPNRINKIGNKEIIFENITHDVIIAALFQRLSGEKYCHQFVELPGELEFLKVDVSKEGKATMQFRNYKKDVTERLKDILSF